MTLRPATTADLPAIAAIQSSSPESSQWLPTPHDTHVALFDTQVVAFVVTRQTASDEREILNIAVTPSHRRRGIARRLLEEVLAHSRGDWFLEVRESNIAAIGLYQTLGFRASGRRPEYYHDPLEAAIVMRIHS
jgi:ribosomal-protein-alanine N-acetyltransferase